MSTPPPKKKIGSDQRGLTVVDSSRDKTGEREHPIEDAVCGVYQSGILEATGAEVRNSAEHANGRETGYPWGSGKRCEVARGQKRTYQLGQPESWGI
jgi:hypothetical protein